MGKITLYPSVRESLYSTMHIQFYFFKRKPCPYHVLIYLFYVVRLRSILWLELVTFSFIISMLFELINIVFRAKQKQLYNSL